MYLPNEWKIILISKQMTTTSKATDPLTMRILCSWLAFLVTHQREFLVDAYRRKRNGIKKRRSRSHTEEAEENMREW